MPAGRVVDRLAAAGCVAAEEEAEELAAAASDERTLEALVRRREAGEPLAWITGKVCFCGRSVLVDPGVYVPRAQTEELALRAEALLAAARPRAASPERAFAADLCTGSGAVALHLKRSVPASFVVGVDSDAGAGACARSNGVPAIVADLGEALPPKVFDVVTAVAPYVPTAEIRFLPADVQRYEPRHALDGGSDGLDLVRRVVESAARLLRPGAWLLTEIGGDQHRRLGPTLEAHGFGSVSTWSDEDGDVRGIEARLSAGE